MKAATENPLEATDMGRARAYAAKRRENIKADTLADQGTYFALGGLALLPVVQLVQAVVANWALAARFSEWLSDRSIRSGLPVSKMVFSVLFMMLIAGAAMVHYSFLGRFELLSTFPALPELRLTGIAWPEALFAFCVVNGEALFDMMTFAIRLILGALAMLVIAWLIGAKGLGEDVMKAFQYANMDHGILTGFAILFCVMIPDRIVQDQRT